MSAAPGGAYIQTNVRATRGKAVLEKLNGTILWVASSRHGNLLSCRGQPLFEHTHDHKTMQQATDRGYLSPCGDVPHPPFLTGMRLPRGLWYAFLKWMERTSSILVIT
jgi:hypothetical protein